MFACDYNAKVMKVNYVNIAMNVLLNVDERMVNVFKVI